MTTRVKGRVKASKAGLGMAVSWVAYGLYLFHPLIGWTAMSVALKYTNQWIALIVGLIVSIVSGWIMYALIERQSVRISRMVKLDVPVLRERTS